MTTRIAPFCSPRAVETARVRTSVATPPSARQRASRHRPDIDDLLGAGVEQRERRHRVVAAHAVARRAADHALADAVDGLLARQIRQCVVAVAGRAHQETAVVVAQLVADQPIATRCFRRRVRHLATTSAMRVVIVIVVVIACGVIVFALRSERIISFSL